MSKLSDIGLLLLMIGTFLNVFSFISSFNISPNLFLYLQIFGWIFIAIALIFIFITKEEYHVIILKNNFPLKLDHLIIFICAMAILISFLILVDINSFRYTGKFTYFTIVWLVAIFGGAFILYFVRKQKS